MLFGWCNGHALHGAIETLSKPLVLPPLFGGCNGHALHGAIETRSLQEFEERALQRCNGHALHGAIETLTFHLFVWKLSRCNGHALHGAIETVADPTKWFPLLQVATGMRSTERLKPCRIRLENSKRCARVATGMRSLERLKHVNLSCSFNCMRLQQTCAPWSD